MVLFVSVMFQMYIRRMRGEAGWRWVWPFVFSNVQRHDKTGSDITWVTALLLHIMKIIPPGSTSPPGTGRPHSALIQDQGSAAGAWRCSNLCGPLIRWNMSKQTRPHCNPLSLQKLVFFSRLVFLRKYLIFKSLHIKSLYTQIIEK